MAYKDQCPIIASQFFDSVKTLFFKLCISSAECFIDYQDIGANSCSN